MMLLGSALAQADAARRFNLDIPAQNLDAAVRAVAFAVDYKVLYPSELVDKKISPTLKGSYTAAEALEIILRETNLSFRIERSSVIVIREKLAERRGAGEAGQNWLSDVGRAVAAALAVASATGAMAQEQPDLAEITVTGSRIVRDGMSAPTPVSVLGAERLEERGSPNIGDVMNEIPSFRATQSPSTGASGGYVGGNVLDLRGLGASRTLVLVDGKRFVPSTTVGTVDTNMIPSILLERAEVVTGGASSQYGSDAVAGVVNFFLNDRLQGLRSSVGYSFSDYSDDKTTTAKLAGGFGLLEGRGHFVAAVEFEKNEGVEGCLSRDWCREGWNNVGARPVGQESTSPANTVAPNVHHTSTSPTGVINGPASLRGITFNADGSPRRFQYGSPVSAIWMVDGEGPPTNTYFSGIPIVAPTERYVVHTITSFDLKDSVTARLDVSAGQLEGSSHANQIFSDAYTIRRGNPFIPTSSDPSLDINTIMAANNLQTFTLGRNFDEYGYPVINSKNKMLRAVGSLNGKFGSGWTWDGYYQYGRNDFRSTVSQLGITANIARALDAVRNGAGSIVCAVNADANPANDDPACVPLNPFGDQVAPGVASYIQGESVQTNLTKEHVVAANVQGPVFSTWAGPVNVAVGVEYRTDKIDGDADAISQARGFQTNSASLIAGKVAVDEAYLETLVPLANGLPFAEAIELNGAVRRTHYDRRGAGTSSESYATTWKAGAVWQPLRPLRFRVTRSRDIRAPNVTELFGPVMVGNSIVSDPALGGAQYIVPATTGSNPELAAEVANTTTVGFVLQPDSAGALGRMKLSVDYYDIDIEDSIGTLGTITIVRRCFLGAAQYCRLTQRDTVTGRLTAVSDVRQNVNQMFTKGYDLEFSYAHPGLLFGDMEFRLLATYVKNLATTDSAGTTDRAGQTGFRAGTIPGIPEYTLDGMIDWKNGPASLSLHTRYIPSGIYNADFIGPRQRGYNVALGNSSNINDVPAALYFDVVGQFDFSSGSNGGIVAYAGINNIGDRDPPRRPGANTVGNNVLFDPVGRTYMLGMRFKY